MADADPVAEIERLRAEVEGYRQRELDGLRTALASAMQERDHYRAEAKRIEATGRQLAHDYESRLNELRTKLAAYTNVSVNRAGYVNAPGRGGS